MKFSDAGYLLLTFLFLAKSVLRNLVIFEITNEGRISCRYRPILRNE